MSVNAWLENKTTCHVAYCQVIRRIKPTLTRGLAACPVWRYFKPRCKLCAVRLGGTNRNNNKRYSVNGKEGLQEKGCLQT